MTVCSKSTSYSTGFAVQSFIWNQTHPKTHSWWCRYCYWAKMLFETLSWQNQQNDCVHSDDSDQPGHLPSLIRVFAVRSIDRYGPKVSSCRQLRLWSDWADAQADLSLRWAHSHFVGFVMRWLTYLFCVFSHPNTVILICLKSGLVHCEQRELKGLFSQSPCHIIIYTNYPPELLDDEKKISQLCHCTYNLIDFLHVGFYLHPIILLSASHTLYTFMGIDTSDGCFWPGNGSGHLVWMRS